MIFGLKIDYKYIYVRFLQNLVLLSNLLQKTFIKDKIFELKGDENILILKLDRIGDAIWTIYFLRILKSRYPNIKITLICNSYNFFVFKDNIDIFYKYYILNEKPQGHFVKYVYDIFRNILEPFFVYFRNKKFFADFSGKYDLVLNLTGRNYCVVSKILGVSMGGGVGVFNFIYDYPFLGHNEIGSSVHVVEKWLKKFGIVPNSLDIDNISSKKNEDEGYFGKDTKKILLFIGGKHINRLKDYKMILQKFKDRGFEVSTISDDISINADHTINMGDDGFMVDGLDFKDFLKGYVLFIGIDGGIIHFVNQYIKCLTFYGPTNHKVAYPYGGKLILLNKIGKCQLYISQNKKMILATNGFFCSGCFQIGCNDKKCLNFIDNDIEIVINELLFMNFI